LRSETRRPAKDKMKYPRASILMLNSSKKLSQALNKEKKDDE